MVEREKMMTTLSGLSIQYESIFLAADSLFIKLARLAWSNNRVGRLPSN